MYDKIYCYPGSDVLINKLNIQDQHKLFIAEKHLTLLRINDLLEEPVPGVFDSRHLKDIHHYIFQDIYSWAGEFRTVDIAKSNLFCKVEYLHEHTESLSSVITVKWSIYFEKLWNNRLFQVHQSQLILPQEHPQH